MSDITVEEYVRSVAMEDNVADQLSREDLVRLLHEALEQAGWCLWHCGTRHFREKV